MEAGELVRGILQQSRQELIMAWTRERVLEVVKNLDSGYIFKVGPKGSVDNWVWI